MGHYDVALICLNGHVINSLSSSSPEHNTKFCEQCGEASIRQCPSCEAPIRGEYQAEGVVVIGAAFSAPSHCHNCGKPYPWTERRAQALKELLQELEELSQIERDNLEKSIPDILSETPETPTAVLLFKKLFVKLGANGSKAMIDLLKNVATDYVKQQLGI
jgi:hypothetical protein